MWCFNAHVWLLDSHVAESVSVNVSLWQFSRWMQWTSSCWYLSAGLVSTQEEFALFYRKFFEAPGAAGFVTWTHQGLSAAFEGSGCLMWNVWRSLEALAVRCSAALHVCLWVHVGRQVWPRPSWHQPRRVSTEMYDLPWERSLGRLRQQL